jgi:hypothetical protein
MRDGVAVSVEIEGTWSGQFGRHLGAVIISGKDHVAFADARLVRSGVRAFEIDLPVGDAVQENVSHGITVIVGLEVLSESSPMEEMRTTTQKAPFMS